MRKSVLAATIVLTGALALFFGRVSPAHAHGPDALWQIGMSFNCDNRSVCGPDLGGFWGWAEFDRGGEGDAQLTGCEHMIGGRAGGAQHFSVDVHGWTIASGSAGPRTFFVTSETDTVTGRNGGPPVTVDIPSEFMDTGIPAVAGHYSTSQVLGMNAPPGVSIQIQVVQLRPA